MEGWKSILKSDPIAWLLERDNPSVRFFTLTEILGMDRDAPEVTETRRQIMETGVVPRILARQEKEGCWGIPEDFYIRSKYRGTVWQFIVLAELGADGSDNRIKKAGEFILNNSQDRQSGGFAYRKSKDNGGDHNRILPCLTGNMVWCLIRFGYLEDPRVQHGIEWIVRYQRFDDRIEKAPRGWPYDKYQQCWGKHTCHMGVVKTLKALAEIPPDRRTSPVRATIEKAAEYMLNHRVHKMSHNPARVANPRWLQFGFPLMWNIDALEVLSILTRLGYRDARMQEAIDLVISKQTEQGRWTMENTFNGRFLVNIERKGKPSKWVTLNSLRTLKMNR